VCVHVTRAARFLHCTLLVVLLQQARAARHTFNTASMSSTSHFYYSEPEQHVALTTASTSSTSHFYCSEHEHHVTLLLQRARAARHTITTASPSSTSQFYCSEHEQHVTLLLQRARAARHTYRQNIHSFVH